jgi:alpha-mannosidase
MSAIGKLEKMARVYLDQTDLELPEARPHYWGRRAVLELQYAAKLSESEGGAGSALVAEAVELAWGAFRTEGELSRAAAEAVERKLAPLAAKAKGYSLICVGHAHIDMNWMWGYDETVSVTLETFRTMLDLMEEYPEFTFGQSQASTYEIVEKHCPEMLEEIKKRVREGRWEVTASTWVEADRNMPNLESMARHFLYTKQYLSSLLDIDPKSLDIDYEPDTFGHHINVPEALCDGGVRYYYHCRGFNDHVLYNWKAPSGRSILVYLEKPTWYNWTMDGQCALVVPGLCKQLGLDSMLRVYGVGDHGGGPTRRDIEKIIDMNRWPVFPVFRFGTYREFFALAEKNRDAFPAVEGELNFVFDGCYTTQTRQKRGNRLGEATLAEAEGLSALAKLAAGAPYDTGGFAAAWKKVLFNQFHDILPGSGVAETREYAMGQYQEAFAIANTARTAAVRALSAAADTSALGAPEDVAMSMSEGAGAGFGISEGKIAQVGRHAGRRRLFTVYNPLPWAREELTEFTVWDWPGDAARMKWTDAGGSALRHQVLGGGKDGYWGHRYAGVLVQVKAPAMGYATVVLDEAEPETLPAFDFDAPRTAQPACGVMENEYLRVELDIRDGGILSLIDKETGMEYVRPGRPAGVFRLVEEDTIRGMSAWTVGRYRNVNVLNRGVKFTAAEIGPEYLRQSATYVCEFGNGSSVAAALSLDAGSRLLRVDVKANWQEIGSAKTCYPQLNFFLPVAYAHSAFRYDVPMGAIDREPLEMDVPAQSYGMPVNASGRSLMLVSDSKYGYRGAAEGLSLTLIRSSADPDPWPEVGAHHIRMAVALTDGGRAEAARTASSFCRGFVVAAARAHAGSLPVNLSLMDLSGGVLLSAVKQSENGRGIIVRYYEAEGSPGEARLKFFRRPKAARAVNLLEQPADGAVRIEGGEVVFGYRKYGVGSLLIEF